MRYPSSTHSRGLVPASDVNWLADSSCIVLVTSTIQIRWPSGIQRVAREVGVTDKHLITQGHVRFGTALITFGRSPPCGYPTRPRMPGGMIPRFRAV